MGQLKEAFLLLQRKQTGILISYYIYRFMKNNIDDWWYNLWLIYNILLSFPLDCHRKNYYLQKSLQHSRGPPSWNSIETTSFGLVISVPKQRESSRLCFGFLSLFLIFLANPNVSCKFKLHILTPISTLLSLSLSHHWEV